MWTEKGKRKHFRRPGPKIQETKENGLFVARNKKRQDRRVPRPQAGDSLGMKEGEGVEERKTAQQRNGPGGAGLGHVLSWKKLTPV